MYVHTVLDFRAGENMISILSGQHTSVEQGSECHVILRRILNNLAKYSQHCRRKSGCNRSGQEGGQKTDGLGSRAFC